MGRRTQPGLAAAVVGVAVVVSIGASVGASAGQVMVCSRPGESTGTIVDRQAMAQWLAKLTHAARSWRSGAGQARMLDHSAPAAIWGGSQRPAPVLAAGRVDRSRQPLCGWSASPFAFHLIDLPPPVC